MAKETRQKVTLSVATETLRYVDEYRDRHGLSSRSAVVTLALRALREHELEAGYKALAEE